MAYGKKYDIDYKSMANEDFTLEIWIDGFSGSSTEINLGSSGPEIKYETSNQEKFSHILASSLEIPFIVENVGMQDFIDDLRDGTLEEKDVYVHLYNSRDSLRPLWSGFLIMDLAAKEDVSFPYEVKLTAVDGLSLLKDRPFVRDTNVDTGLDVEFPYNEGDVYWNVYDKIVDWIEIILKKTGSATSTQGIGVGGSYTYKTSVNWYNSEMPSTGQADDPLFWTQCKMNSLYTRNEDGNYTPQSFYDVLEALCKSWGMRCVYWHHTFHFVQIAEYDIAESGTTAAPVNIPTREYYWWGAAKSNEAYIGSLDFGRYDLQFENVTNPSYGLQKLAGTQYDFYAPIKRVIGKFNVFSDENNFNGFPLLTSTPFGTAAGDVIESQSITSYVDIANSSGFYCQIPLTFTNSANVTFGQQGLGSSQRVCDMQMTFSIRARAAGTTPWTKMLTESGTTLSWSTYTAPTSSNGVPDDMINVSVNYIPIGISQRIVWDSATYTNGIIPTDAAFTGEWEFEFFTYTEVQGNNWSNHGNIQASTGFSPLMPPSQPDTVFDYSNVFDANNEFTGIFAQVTSGSIGNNTINSEYTTNTSDSYTIELKDLYWGDSPTVDSASSLRVWNGSAFVKADASGDWGKGTLSGTNNFNELLANEIIKCQNISSQRMNVSSALSETDKLTSTKLKMVNPVGRLKDINSEKYVFLSGTYNTLRDQWIGVWFQFTYDSGIVVTTADEGQEGPLSGPVLGGGAQGNSFGNGAQSMRMPWSATEISQRISAGSITSLDIVPVGYDIIFSGDEIFLTDRKSGQYLEFKVSSDVAAADTTISVFSKTITEDIREGSIIGINYQNLFEQYQRKTEGQVAGFDIDADGITKGGVEITGWLDRDDFTGATANNVPTAESVKAYVDGKTHANNFAALTCSGTSLSSATDGAANAVVVAYDTETTTSDTNTIIVYGATGVPDVTGGEYCFSVTPDEHPTKTAFEFSWSVGLDNSVANNRILVGAKLQQGVDSSGTMVWTDVDPTTSFAYNRGTGNIRFASTSNGMFVVIEAAQPIQYFRLVFWKEAASNASMKAITTLTGTNFRIKQIN